MDILYMWTWTYWLLFAAVGFFLNHFPPVVGRRDSVSHGSSSDEWLVLGSVVCSISCPYGLRKKSGRHRRRSVIVCCQKMSNLFSSSLVHRWSRNILRRAGRMQSLASLCVAALSCAFIRRKRCHESRCILPISKFRSSHRPETRHALHEFVMFRNRTSW